MTRRRGGLTSVLLLAAIALTACGDDEADGPKADPERDKAVAALAERLEADNKVDEEHQVISSKEAACVAASMVDGVGVEKLVKLKVLKKNLSSAKLPTVLPKPLRNPQVDALSECVGLVDYWLRSTRELMRAVAATPEAEKKAGDDELWKSLTTCLEGQISEKKMRKAMLASIDNPNAAKRTLGPAMSTCEKQVG